MDTLNMAKNSLECHGDKFADVIVCIILAKIAEATNTYVTATWFAFIERDIYIHQ